MSKKQEKKKDSPVEKPVSLHPLKFEEAVKTLLEVDPKKTEKKQRKKK